MNDAPTPRRHVRAGYVLRTLGATLWAFATAVIGRIRRGPRRPGWTWTEELFAAVSRAVIHAAARDPWQASMVGRGPAPPIARRVRREIEIGEVNLGGVRAERYVPRAERRGTILYAHGGGFVSGSVAWERRPAAELAVLTGCETFSIDYRLAPSHPYPAALDDAVAAYRALLARGCDPQTIVLVGGSAGACLSASLLLRLRAEELPLPVGAVLLWPYTDFTFDFPSLAAHDDADVLSAADLRGVWGPAYVGSADPHDPFVSPSHADLRGLPPLLVIAGGAEVMLSAAEHLADAARATGVEVQFTVYPHKVHAWMALRRLPATIDAVDEIVTWFDQRLGAGVGDQAGAGTSSP